VPPSLVPEWWLAELRAALARLPKAPGTRGRRVQLALLLVPAELTGAERRRALTAAKTRVTRFLDGRSRTLETAEEIRRALELPRFMFLASDLATAEALQLAETLAARWRKP